MPQATIANSQLGPCPVAQAALDSEATVEDIVDTHSIHSHDLSFLALASLLQREGAEILS